MMQVALIACSNGYGHVRRLLLLSQELLKYQLEVTLFAPLVYANKLIMSCDICNIPLLVDFDSKTTISDWLSGEAEEWYKNLPDLSKYNIVVSDNLIEVLNIRSDAWLFGSFFWHISLQGVPLDIKYNANKLLEKHHPRMISTKLFSANYLSDCTDLYEVGVFSGMNTARIGSHKKDALVACGRGGQIEEEISVFINELSKTDSVPFHQVFVEPTMLPNNKPDWMLPAEFTADMYEKISVAIIRPGVGTVTDALVAGAKIFAFYEDGNIEMQHTAQQLAKFELGCNCKLIDLAWTSAISYYNDERAQLSHQENILTLDKNGAKNSAELLLQSL